MIELKGVWKGERKEKKGKEERGDRGRNEGEGEGRKRKREEKKGERRGERTEKNKENEKGQQHLLNPPWSSGNFFAKNIWDKYPDSSEVKCHRRTNFLVLVTKSIAFPDGCFYFCRETKKLMPGVLSFSQPPSMLCVALSVVLQGVRATHMCSL